MNQVKSFLSIVLFVFTYIVSAQSPDSTKKLPSINLPRSPKIDVKHIAIDLRFDWQKKQAYGTTTITLSPLNPTNAITLDAGMLTINSVKLAKGAQLKFDYDGGDKNDGLAITLDHNYKAGEQLTIQLDYHTNWVNMPDPNSLWGTNGKGIRFSEPTSNDPVKMREIWSMGEPQSNRFWFPAYDSPNDLRTTEFTATVDKKFTVISNGILVETKTNPDGTRTFHWQANIPYANHLTSFIIGEFVEVKQTYEGIQLHNFGYPHETAAVKASVERLPDMVKFFSEATGVKYPYPNYSQVFVQDFGTFMGNNSVSIITENMVDDFRTHADFFYLWDLTEAEALAHQWFGNYITSRDWSHVWLNKSFAHYFNELYTEHKNGREEFLLYQLLFDQNTYLLDWNAGYRHPIVTQNYDNREAFISDNHATMRGGMVLHMLRKHLGEEKWLKAIKLYMKSNANKLVSTEDFRKAVEEVAGESMQWFFNQWLYKMGHPVFKITRTYDEAKKQLKLQVEQTQKTDSSDPYPQAEFFAGKVDIAIDGKIEHVWVEPKANNTFTFAVTQQPKLINFDYESTWIKELIFEKTFEEWLYQLQHDKDILARRSAMTELVKLARNDKTSTENKTKIYAALRELILSDAYWRLRAGALAQLQSLLAPATATNVSLDEATTTMLLTTIKRDQSWVRASAISFLGTSRDPKFADIYLNALSDSSERVISTAAIALGKSKSPKAFEALVKLINKPSWKNQSLMSALNGLKELGDPRGFDTAFNALSDLNLLRWRLPTPSVWDFRVFATETIAALGKSEAAYPLLFERFKKSISENDINGIFSNTVLITALADPRGQEVFDLLKATYKDDANTMVAVNQYEEQFKEAIKKQ